MSISDWKWREDLERDREMKNRFLAESPESPIPTEQRGHFVGNGYYPIDPAYRLEIPLHGHKEKTTVRMAYSKGQEQDFLRWGEFRVVIEGKEQSVQVFKSNPSEDKLFVVFRDATSGKGTYGAGRYLDLETGLDQTPDGKWIVDLNKAYSPWCVYSEDYTCPLAPPENWLDVSVHAGEKLPIFE